MIKIFARSSVLLSEKKDEITKNKSIIMQIFAPKVILRTELLFEYDPISHNQIENYIEEKKNRQEQA